MKKVIWRVLAMALVLSMALCFVSCGEETTPEEVVSKSPLDPASPTSITIWNYYNGDQLTAFDTLVSEFNSTVGIKQGIAVESVSQGSIDNLADSLIDAAEGKVGAQDLPTLASVYAETAYILHQNGKLANLDNYFTAEELSAYVPSFIEEGRMFKNGELLLFPVSKSTECFAVNATDWAAFEAASGISVASIVSYEDLTAAAEKYYNWTDSLTPAVKEDGKALYGRDSVANYIYVGTTQLGNEMFNVTQSGMTQNLDKATFKTLWDNFYIPYINGYFTKEANHCSEDMKTGTVLAMTSSTSSVSYLPTVVTDSNDKTHDISITISKPLSFKSGEKTAVQQGAGYCVVKGTEAQQYAAAQFLKWFTEPQRNLQFSVSSGYSPVTTAANNAESINANFKDAEKTAKNTNILNGLLVGADVYINEKTYTSKPFDGSKDVRNVLDDALSAAANNDRKTVEASIAAGKTRAEAVAPFVTQEYFEQWFTSLNVQVTETVK